MIEEKDMILVDATFYNDRCYKATDRLIKLKETADKLDNILNGGNSLDNWNGFGSGYVYVREEITALREELKAL